MNGRKQNIDTLSDQLALKVEPDVQTFMGITENHLTAFKHAKVGLLEYILSPSNLNLAYKQVKNNKGSGGIDRMKVDDLLSYLLCHKDKLISSIYDGKYHPNPVRRVEIPKSNGKKRNLGIPTVVDRLIQQAISQVLQPLYEPQFSPTSYGFRPHRSAHDALLKCGEYISAGYVFTVDMDLEKFFDTVCHSKLIKILSRTIKDGRVVSLIHKYLNSGVLIGGNTEGTSVGVPQGGPLSPLLSNTVLNEPDNESYFFAELKRLKLIIDKLEVGEELFIILDEILKGTNSMDKQKGSFALIKQFMNMNTNGIIATHDLLLGTLIESFPQNICNYCFEADIMNNELTFSYQMRDGVAQNMNACFLMKKMGIAVANDFPPS